jgi:hypothetical protein
MTAVYAVIMLTALCGFVSLAVDWGRVQLVKTQLQRTADAAARAAASQLASGITATQRAAVTWAGYNKADETPVIIDATNDVEFGVWDTHARTFTPLTGSARSSANAVRVWARRIAARGTAVRLTFGALVGQPTCDVNAFAIAMAGKPAGPGIVGIDTMNLDQKTQGYIDSYDSSQGAHSSSNSGSSAVVASNSDINLNASTIRGDVHPGIGRSALGVGYFVSGGISNLSTPLSYPPVVIGAYDNSGLPAPYYNGTDFTITGNTTVTIPAGTYSVRDFLLTNNVTLSAAGPVTFYVSRNLDFDKVTVNAYQHRPGNFVVKFVSGATMQVHKHASVEGDFYGPSIAFSIYDNNTAIFGRLICDNLQQTHHSTISQDISLTGAGSGGISTVK